MRPSHPPGRPADGEPVSRPGRIVSRSLDIIPYLIAARTTFTLWGTIHIGPWYAKVSGILSAVILLFCVVALATVPQVRRTIRNDWIAVIFGIWCLSLLPWLLRGSSGPLARGLPGAAEWMRLASLWSIYVLVVHLTARRSPQYLLGVLFLSLLVPLMAGSYQLAYQQGHLIDDIHRIYGSLRHPNSFAFYLVVFIGLTIGQVKWSRRHWVFLLLLPVEIVMLLGTFSLAGSIMFLFLLLLLAFSSRGRFRLLMLVLFAAFVIAFLLSDYGQARIHSIWHTLHSQAELHSGDSDSTISSLHWRFQHWQAFLEEWRRQPWIGHGLQSYRRISLQAPHNDYLKSLYETGVVGVFCYAGFLALVGRELVRRVRRVSTVQAPSLPLISLVLFLCWLVGSLSDNLLASGSFQYYFWAIAALSGSGIVLGGNGNSEFGS